MQVFFLVVTYRLWLHYAQCYAICDTQHALSFVMSHDTAIRCMFTSHMNCEIAYGTQCDMDMILHCMQVSVPNDETSYWCKAFVFPDEVLEQTHYITKVTSCMYNCIIMLWIAI